eukprot:ANDGO_00476.mRNA.1 hypothetical protein
MIVPFSHRRVNSKALTFAVCLGCVLLLAFGLRYRQVPPPSPPPPAPPQTSISSLASSWKPKSTRKEAPSHLHDPFVGHLVDRKATSVPPMCHENWDRLPCTARGACRMFRSPWWMLTRLHFLSLRKDEIFIHDNRNAFDECMSDPLHQEHDTRLPPLPFSCSFAPLSIPSVRCPDQYSGNSRFCSPSYPAWSAMSEDHWISKAFEEDYIEANMIHYHVLASGSTFVMAELGAGHALWTLVAASALKQVKHVHRAVLIGVEANPSNHALGFEFLKEFAGESFEATPISHENLRGSRVKIDNRVTVFWINNALTNHSGDTILFADEVGQLGSFVGVKNDAWAKTQPSIMQMKESPVRTITLADLFDALLQTDEIVDVIDIDLQTFELLVLSGDPRVINQRVRSIHIGTHVDLNTPLRLFLQEHGWHVMLEIKRDCWQRASDGIIIAWNPAFLMEKMVHL